MSLAALCNRGWSCQASAESLAYYAEPPPTEDRMRVGASVKLSSLTPILGSFLATYTVPPIVCYPPPESPSSCEGDFAQHPMHSKQQSGGASLGRCSITQIERAKGAGLYIIGMVKPENDHERQ